MKVELRKALRFAATTVPAFALAVTASAQTVIPTVLGTATVNARVGGATLSPDGQNLWVASYSNTTDPGQISVFNVANLIGNPSSATAVSTIAVGVGPSDIAFSSNAGRAFVTNFYGASFSVVSIPSGDTSTGTVKQNIPLSSSSFPFGVAYSANHIVVTDQGTSSVVPTFTNTSTVTLEHPNLFPATPNVTQLSGRPALPVVGAQKGTALIPGTQSGAVSGAGLAVANLHTGNYLAGVTISTDSEVAAQQVVVSPDGNTAYVSLFDSSGVTDGGVAVINLKTLKLTTIIDFGDPFGYGLAISPDGKYLLATGDFSNEVALIDTASKAVDYVLPSGNQPDAIAITADGSHAFLTNTADGTVTTIAFSPNL